MIGRTKLIRVTHSTPSPGCKSIEADPWRILKVVKAGFHEEAGNTCI